MMLLHFFLKTEKYNDEGEFAYTPTEHGPVAVAARTVRVCINNSPVHFIYIQDSLAYSVLQLKVFQRPERERKKNKSRRQFM